ncbi:protachykinin-like isoform X1 [Erpetoichthys calabaricus]|uniref:protachykinin-like isoform X1 n=1 Tax=Erpetoichthys calabaricus TaxID=27687 RepID=UPI00223471E6|nr:protachykinin-like isoform X1 [Erpetoichthys calabaricus]
METIRFVILAVVLFAQVYCDEEASPDQEGQYWSAETWQDEVPDNSIAQQFAELIKRSKSHQFYGLMGRRSGTSGSPQTVPLGRKRHKGEMFVGLMGRRSSSGEMSEELDRTQPYGRRRK